MNNLTELYNELILDHCRHPRHFGPLTNPTHTAHGFNPLCGDDIEIFAQIDNGLIVKLQFTGKGCAICLASASMMAVLLKDKTMNEANHLFELFHTLLTTDNPKPNSQILGKLEVLANVKKYPMRVKCATLPWHTLKAALTQKANIISTEIDQSLL
jgi:nitrogen fixation protein NifU and related proteins